jgi:dihydrolipoamide dehydrogenase
MAADQGLEVTLVERDSRLGGTCLLRGCIPSKALLHVAKVIDEAEELSSGWGIRFAPPRIELDALRARKNQILQRMSDGLTQLAKRRQVRVVHAHGSLRDAQTLQLQATDSDSPDDDTLTFDHLILATGSLPAIPTSLALESPQVMDSTAALELESVPENLLVIGGGYIGLEMGMVYAKLGSRLSVVELTEGLLPGVDRDLVKPLQKRFEELTEGRIFLNT